VFLPTRVTLFLSRVGVLSPTELLSLAEFSRAKIGVDDFPQLVPEWSGFKEIYLQQSYPTCGLEEFPVME
jgi:hypothetical protein